MRKFSWKIYLLAFFVTTFIFLLGVYVSNLSLNQARIITLNQLDDAKESLLEVQLLTLLDDDPALCPYYKQQFESIAKQRETLGYEIEALEKRESVSDLKSKYYIFEVMNYILANKLNTTCNQTYMQALYFYPANCSNCKEFESSLRKLKEKGYLIYSFGAEEDVPIVEYLLLKYNITTYPAVYCNGSVFYNATLIC